MDTRVLLNWISYLLHCLAMTMLLLTFSVPYWYASNETVDGKEIAGIWVRCKVGGSCRPVDDILEPMKINITPVQALMTISLILVVITFGLYSLWLWKGEGCTTPWRKRCESCRESYYRSTRPTVEAADKYGRLKYVAFILATLSGVFIVAGSIFFMTELMTIEGLHTSNIGWASWVALTTGILLLLQNGVISLFFYVLKRPDLSVIQDGDNARGDDIYVMEEVDEKELERIRKWIVEQKSGVENPSFEGEYEVVTRPKPHRAKNTRSGSSTSSIYYPGLDRTSSTMSGSGYRPPRIISSRDMKSLRSNRPNKMADYVPAYSYIFKDKIPMIPKPNFSPQSRFHYDVIYHGNKMARRRLGAGSVDRPASHLGINSSKDDITKDGHVTRSASDTDLNRGELDDNPYETYTYLPSGKRIKVHYSQEYLDSLEPGVLPEAYRRRKHSSRRSTSSLPTMTSLEPEYIVRSKYPGIDSSGSSGEMPSDNKLSHGLRGLDLASPKPTENFQLDNIWVLPNKEHIQRAIGRNHVHFKLEQSIQELDEFEFDDTQEFDDTPVFPPSTSTAI